MLETNQLSPSDLLAAHREQFRASLVGLWTSEAGSFMSVMCEYWNLREDGTGSIQHYGPFFALEDEIAIAWRQVGDWHIEYEWRGWLKRPWDMRPEDDPFEGPDEPSSMTSLHYGFQLEPTEGGGQIVALFNTAAPPTRPRRAGDFRLYYVGPPRP